MRADEENKDERAGAWVWSSGMRGVAEAVAGQGLRVHAVRGESVYLLEGPREYFDTLCRAVQAARTRIVMAALDIGSGEKEMLLMDRIVAACRDNPQLQVTLLLDHSRMNALKEFRVAKQRLQEMVKVHQGQIQVGYFQSPEARQWYAKLLPSSCRQNLGVTHMKALVFDDTVVLIGANLNGVYFDNRQDRYLRIQVQSRELADTYSRIVEALCVYSRRLQEAHWWRAWRCVSWVLSPEEVELRDRLHTALTQEPDEGHRRTIKGGVGDGHGDAEADTWVVVSLQLASLDLREDHGLYARLFHALPKGSHVRVSTGWCVSSEPVIEGLRSHAEHGGHVDLLLPSTQTSTITFAAQPRWWYAKCVAGVYDGLESWARVRVEGKGGECVSVYEFTRNQSSCHAKGLWISSRGGGGAVDVALIGSSNFDPRGLERDLESEALIFTDNQDLACRLRGEWERLLSDATCSLGSGCGRKHKRENGCQRCCARVLAGVGGSYL